MENEIRDIFIDEFLSESVKMIIKGLALINAIIHFTYFTTGKISIHRKFFIIKHLEKINTIIFREVIRNEVS